jgi:colanic acid/amylovoran biosynthesis glycosyltransferase
VSQAISKEGDKIYNSPNKIDLVVYTGLDISQFQFKSKVFEEHTLQIISVGRPHWIKGYDIALKTLALLKMKGLQFNYQIIGAEGNQELLFLRKELDLETEVEFLPKLPQQKVFDAMQTSSVFLLPSIEEGIANVAVEAMALGCPVISTNCGGMEELITHQKEGWIVPVYDSKAMAEHIIVFSQLDSEYIQSIKHAARLKVEQQHNKGKMIEDMIQLYSKILSL